MSKQNRLVRLDAKTLERLKKYKRDVQSIEQNDIPLGEIIRRLSNGEDMSVRLKIGAMERKKGIKK